MSFYPIIQYSSAAIFIKRPGKIKLRKTQKGWWKPGWRNHCGSDSAGRWVEKFPYAITVCFAFSPVVWVSVCGFFVAESTPSQQTWWYLVARMWPISRCDMQDQTACWYESALLQWSYAISPVQHFLKLSQIFSLEKFELCAKIQLDITKTVFLALQKNVE